MTYGELRLRISQSEPGLSLDLIDGWISDRYTAILDRLAWSRAEAQTVIQTVAEYSAGTVSVVNASAAIVGTGTTWTTGMSGRMIRFGAENAWYQFTWTTATAGTLDRPYEGGTTGAATYRITSNVLALPADARIVSAVNLLNPPASIPRTSIFELNVQSPNRGVYGIPDQWAPFMDSQTNPPTQQVELFPIPTTVMSFSVQYVYDAALSEATSATLLPWVRPAALMAGILADSMMHQKAFHAAKLYEDQFDRRVSEMTANEYRRVGGTPIQLSEADAAHRIRRNRW